MLLAMLTALLLPAHADPAMWVVRDADSTLYLFGTMHLGQPGASWGGAAAREALAAADEVWTEVELGAEAEARMAASVIERCVDPRGRLFAGLKAEERALAGEIASRAGMPMENLRYLQPWCAGLVLSMLPYMEAGYEGAAGSDTQIVAAAQAAGKGLRALETIDQQLDVLAAGTRRQQLAGLRYTLAHLDEGAALLAPMEQAWRAGDVEGLERVALTPMRTEHPVAYDLLLTQRNAAWVEALARELAGEGVDFVAVGALHLVGPESVVAMLRARGLEVEQL